MSETVTHGTSAVGLRWLVNVRWGAALTQVIASVSLGIVAHAIPIAPALACVAPLVLSNAWLARAIRRQAPNENVVFGLLALDVCALSGWLMLAGGPANPWSALYIVYVALGALLLGTEKPWAIVVASCLGYGSTFVFDPLGRDPHAAHRRASGGGELDAHLEGMYVAFVVSSVLIAYFVTRVAAALRDREAALVAAREKTLRVERVAALTTLAAGAAHELGSPLATIAIAAKELERSLERDEGTRALAEDARLVREEVMRCRAILDRMASRAGTVMGSAASPYPLESLARSLEESLGPARFARVDVRLDDASLVVPASAIEPLVENLVRNALDASEDGRVSLDATHDGTTLRLSVVDRGAGMDADTLARARDPFFTTKETGRGMGLGLFLVDSLAQELGGSLSIESTRGVGTTAVVSVPARRAPEGGAAE